jgi:hypothetical protein
MSGKTGKGVDTSNAARNSTDYTDKKKIFNHEKH